MKIAYSGGFSEQEKLNYRSIIITNLIYGIREIIRLVEREDGVKFSDSNSKAVRLLKDVFIFLNLIIFFKGSVKFSNI